MDKIRVSLKRGPDRSYTVYSGSEIFDSVIRDVIGRIKPARVAYVTDSNLLSGYADRLRAVPGGGGAVPVIEGFSAGEGSKNIDTVMELFNALAAAKLDRKSLVIAFGGGVTGDMAGFLASVYMRGVPYVQVPTSLLSMVDSSIGGKTGVDTKAGKNLLGSFYQPAAVITDAAFLKTLPEPEFRNGMAEVIKHGVIMDEKYFHFVIQNADRIKALDQAALAEVIKGSHKIKAAVVMKDEIERGLRQALNYGHTLGHAMEKASSYGIPHGFAVALGMAGEAFISHRRGFLPENDLMMIAAVLMQYGLLAYIKNLRKIGPGPIIEAAGMDKKNQSGGIMAVMIDRIGKVRRDKNRYSFRVDEDEISKAWEYTCSLEEGV